MTNNSEMRQTVFVKKAFQGRFILNVLLLLLLSGFCSAFIIYWITGGDLMAESQTAHANIAHSLENLGLSILIGNLVAMLVVGVATMFVVLYASHKIAGPLYRFERLCQQIGDGQLDTVTSLRQHDQLQDLGTAFGEMVNKLRYRRDQRNQLMKEVNASLDRLEQDSPLATEQKEQLKKIRETLAQFKE